MLQLSEACNMLKYVRVLTWHLLSGFTWQIPEQFWNRTLKLVKKVLHYLQGTKGLMMTYRRSDSLHMVGYSDSDYARVNAYPDVDFLSSRKGELFHGKAQNKLSLHRPQCMTVCSVL